MFVYILFVLQCIVVTLVCLVWRYLNKPLLTAGHPQPWSFQEKLKLNEGLTICVVVVGSTGDVHVFTSLAMELKRRNHNVYVVTDDSFKRKCLHYIYIYIYIHPYKHILFVNCYPHWIFSYDYPSIYMYRCMCLCFAYIGVIYVIDLITGAGLRHIPLLNINIKQNLKKTFYSRFVQAGDSLFTALYKYANKSKMNESKTYSVMEQIADACDQLKPDVMICGSLVCGAVDVAEARGIPCSLVYLAPKTPTRYLVNHLLQLPLNHITASSGHLTKMLYYLYDLAATHPNRKLLNTFRTKRLGLPELSRFIGPRWRAYQQRMTTVYSYSRHFLAAPVDWPDCTAVAGFFPNPPLPTWAPTQELHTFLAEVRLALSLSLSLSLFVFAFTTIYLVRCLADHTMDIWKCFVFICSAPL